MEPINEIQEVEVVSWNPSYRTPYNYNHLAMTKPEISEKPSKTIPNMAMSIKEIVDRYRRGLPLTAGKVPIWDGDEGENPITPPEWDKMDISERDEYIREQSRKLAAYQKKLRQEADQKAIEERKKAYFQEWQAMKDAEGQKPTAGATPNNPEE